MFGSGHGAGFNRYVYEEKLGPIAVRSSARTFACALPIIVHDATWHESWGRCTPDGLE
ncbi:hypothetical protein BN2497_2635 [Janthinobacterium sp. CG23_2]|nr:hypothetical protein BN2497_2635 [Janthinobacterium sp. CG23_2]CUU27715.1 hypothetical protein BN3177_2635 [Janthinobacterium sp. CG23_2]